MSASASQRASGEPAHTVALPFSFALHGDLRSLTDAFSRWWSSIVPRPPQPLEPAAPQQLELFRVDTAKLAPPIPEFTAPHVVAQLLAIDIALCPRCEGRLKVLGAVRHPEDIAAHLHAPARPLPRPSLPDQPTLF